MSTFLKYAILALLFSINYSLSAQEKFPATVFGKPRIPSSTSFYSQTHFRHDLAKERLKYYSSEWTKIYPGKTNPFEYLEETGVTIKDAVDNLKNSEKTLVCDSYANLDDVLSIDDPNSISIANGRAYVAENNKVKYFCRLEYIGDKVTITETQLKTELDIFSAEGFMNGLSPDIITIEFPPGKIVFTAYQSVSTGKKYLYQRINNLTSKIENQFKVKDLFVVYKYFLQCSRGLMNGS